MMNRTEISRPPGVIVSVIGDNRAKANVTVSNGAAISPDGQPGPLLHAPTYFTAGAGHPSDCTSKN